MTIGHVTDSFYLGRDLNRGLDHYQVNWIHDSNNIHTVDTLRNLGCGSFCYIFIQCLRCCQFKNKFMPVNNVLSTTTNKLYKCIVTSG